ncbi:outer membrane beta-barrel protein, partial [Helicobacter pylori]
RQMCIRDSPTINNKYYTTDALRVQMRRVFAFYVGYNYHF